MGTLDTNNVLDSGKLHDPKGAAEYFRAKVAYTTGPVELNRLLENGEDVVVIDVRQRDDFDKGHVPGAINLPEEEWGTARGLSRDKLNIIYCYSQVCHLAAKAALEFSIQGFPVMEMEGGFQAWKDHHFDIEASGSYGRRMSRGTDTLSTTH